ncbi:lipopolysaccharide kinase InaA family protein [Azoarcus olearius]|uniref:Lipopolysaccharide core biosynthesis protein n=1 Tax=Azoarcus sp. (strain BH72) TaxID=418699 RepID=A1KBI0_AZOSB|nr:lipopolysaccharide kinase InaA family protein [Azoarcus olearius]CAL96186.1 lipopolysaccharide core biosynthesis protein [Azoarcus olearius]
MKDFLAPDLRALFARHHLTDFLALWALDLPGVDAPNTGRGGWSSVSRLELADEHGHIHAFYLKRQIDHLSRSLRRPFGEATFAREFRNILRYAEDGVPALQAAFFGQRRIGGKACAILVTRALDDYRPLDAWLRDWPTLTRGERRHLLGATAALVKQLHAAGHLHNCLYPKHIFVRSASAPGAAPAACLIDLEKTRRPLRRAPLLRDLDTLNRHGKGPSAADRLRFLLRYLDLPALDGPSRALVRQLLGRRRHKTHA